MHENTSPHPLVRVADRSDERAGSHPLNPQSEMHGVALGDASGMQRIGINLIRVPPGKESCIYHTHTCEEEFVFILTGRGIAEIDGAEHEVGAGDFMGFPTPSVGHHLRNPFNENLVYLVGGERRDVEIAEFPRNGKHLFRTDRGSAYMIDSNKLERLFRVEKESSNAGRE